MITTQVKTTKLVSVTQYFDKGYTLHGIGPANPSWLLYSEWESDPRNRDGSLTLHNGVVITGGVKGEGCNYNSKWKENAGLWLVRAKFKEGWQYPKFCCPSNKWQLFGFSARSIAVKEKVIEFGDFSNYWDFQDFKPLRNY